jgi:hypothetical protein
MDRRDRDQAAGRGLLRQHLRPAIIGSLASFEMIKDPLDKALAQRQVVEPPFLLQRQKREAIPDLPRGHACAIPSRHAMFIVDADAKQPPRGRILLEGLDTNDIKTSPFR